MNTFDLKDLSAHVREKIKEKYSVAAKLKKNRPRGKRIQDPVLSILKILESRRVATDVESFSNSIGYVPRRKTFSSRS
jgi:hypothetical protein